MSWHRIVPGSLCYVGSSLRYVFYVFGILVADPTELSYHDTLEPSDLCLCIARKSGYVFIVSSSGKTGWCATNEMRNVSVDEKKRKTG